MTSAVATAAPRTDGTGRSRWSGEPDWPAAVRLELDRRFAALPRRGDVLELRTRASLEAVLEAGAYTGSEPWTGLRYDTVICVGALPTVADLPLAVAGLRRRLADDGELYVVEPVGGPGWGDMLVATALAGTPAVRGLHLDRDIPAALRAGGLDIIDLERFTMPTRIWSLRRFVSGRAIGPAPTTAAATGSEGQA